MAKIYENAWQNLTHRYHSIPEIVRTSTFLLTLVCLFFWPMLSQSLRLTPVDMIFTFPFFQGAAPAEFQHATNPLQSDPVLKFYPWRLTVQQAFRNGYFPFWNPYIYSGAPLFANAESAVLYPLSILAAILPLSQALGILAIVHLYIGGIGTFLLLRNFNVGELGSLFGAITFMFGGPMIVWLNYPIGNAYAWTPLLFFLGERLVVQRRLRDAGLCSLVVATQLLAGHYQTSFIVLLAWSIFNLYRLATIHCWPVNLKRVSVATILLVTGVILGIMLASVQLLPFIEWLSLGNEVQLRTQERLSLNSTSYLKDLMALATFAIPNLFGNPTWGSPLSFVYSNYIELTGYVGIIPLALAITAVVSTLASRVRRGKNTSTTTIAISRERGNIILFLALLGMVFLALSMRIPGIDLINQLPIFNVVSPHRYRMIYTFCMALLAGIGAEQVLTKRRNDYAIRNLVTGLLIFCTCATGLLLSIYFVIIYLRDEIIRFNRIATLYPILVKAFSPTNVSMYAPILAAVGAIVALLSYRRALLQQPVTSVIFFIMTLAELFIFGESFNPLIQEKYIFPPVAPATFLSTQAQAGDLFRITAIDDSLPPNTGMPYKFYEIAGVDFPLRRYAEFALASGGTMESHFRITFHRIDLKLASLMNVKYIVSTTASSKIADNQLREVYHDPTIHIYENMNVLPRAYLVEQTRIVADASKILEAMTDSTFNPRTEVIIEEPLHITLPEKGIHSTNSVRIQDYQPNLVVIRVESKDGGVLVLNDTDYPGWRATVDAQPTKIYRANYTFRAIYVSPGTHTIEFSYVPTMFGLGVTVSCGTGLLVLALLIIGSVVRSNITTSQTASPDRKH